MGENRSRPRGILTQADRQYLVGEKELSTQAVRNTRRRIRNRVTHAIQDFSVLWACLPEDDLELIFGLKDDAESQFMRRSIQDMMAFAILALWENDDYYPPRLKYAIQQAAFARNRRVRIDLEIQEDLMDSPDVILQKLLDSGFKHTSFEEFEKAMTHPDADPELLVRLMNELEPNEDTTIEDVNEMQGVWEDIPLVRPILPYIVSAEPDFEH